MGLTDLTLQVIIFRLLALLAIAPVHGVILAGAAALLGDKGPRYDGSLSVVPTGHLDLVGTIGMVLWGLGWGKPLDIDAAQFRGGRIGIVAVILASFLGLLALAMLLAALALPAVTTLPHTAALTTAAFLRAASSLTIWFALFSLIPIPPLAGGMLPEAYGIRIPRQARWVAVVLLLAAIATGVARDLLGPAHKVLESVILGD